ncbi:hypothetical protein DFH29DRAFT_870483 [Suillus ampliporus]|nr:hypothetical protein DFH29DRAFT_870483 [Suillus ampliporus]
MSKGERVSSTITLEELFHRAKGYLGRPPSGDDDDLELKLKIQGFKNLSAVYMSSLIYNIFSQASSKWTVMALKKLVGIATYMSLDPSLPSFSNRSYEVATMDITTFRLSQNFFWRYRLLALMSKIVVEEARTPFEKRTPEWFVSQYIKRFAHPPSDKYERLIYDSSDSDIIDIDEGTTRLPRHPRRIHRSDILGLFAAQSEWFVTDNEVKRKKLFPFKPWNEFRKEVRKARWQARRNNVDWGWPIGREHDPHLESDPEGEEEQEEDDEDDDDTRNLVERNPVTGKTKELVRRKIDKAKAKRSMPFARRVVSSSSESSSDELDPAYAHAYVSDFSEESSTAASDSSDVSANTCLREFGELIPHQLSQVPELPGLDNRWWYNVRDLPGHVVFYLMGKDKGWRSIREDERAQKCFLEMVSKHYEDHFASLGLRFVKTRGRAGIDWTRRPSAHQRGQQDAVIVKEEVI